MRVQTARPQEARLTPSTREAGLNDVLRRVQGEFEEIPGLSLTLRQAQRLFGLCETQCRQVLARLIDNGFLQDVDGSFRRAR